MHYVEILRARRVLFWYTLALLASLAITAVSMFAGHADVHNGQGGIKFADVILACTMGAYIAATCVAPGLIAEAATLAITWTRPVPRAQTAWRFIAVDVATIAIAYAILILVVLSFIALLGALPYVVFGPNALTTFALGLGSAVMWYGLVTLVSARLPGRGGLIAGMSWVAFLLVGSLWAAPLPALLHGLMSTLSYLDPIAYIGGISNGNAHQSSHPIELAQPARLAIAWALAGAALAGTVRLWSTREV